VTLGGWVKFPPGVVKGSRRLVYGVAIQAHTGCRGGSKESAPGAGDETPHPHAELGWK